MSQVKSNEGSRTTVLEPDINAEDKSGDTRENLEDIRDIFNACVCKGGSTIFFNPQRGGSTIFFDWDRGGSDIFFTFLWPSPMLKPSFCCLVPKPILGSAVEFDHPSVVLLRKRSECGAPTLVVSHYNRRKEALYCVIRILLCELNNRKCQEEMNA